MESSQLLVYVDMMPVIQAEEQLAMIRNTALAFGNMSEEGRRSVTRALEAQRDRFREKPGTATREETEALLASSGFKVIRR